MYTIGDRVTIITSNWAGEKETGTIQHIDTDRQYYQHLGPDTIYTILLDNSREVWCNEWDMKLISAVNKE